MIHYVLGHSGAGKTRYCLQIFESIDKAIFLDEFQFLCTSKIVDFILDNKEKIDFWIIHQYLGQMEAPFFNLLYAEARHKYLLDPYSEEDGYNFKL